MSELAIIAPEQFNLTKLNWDDVQAPATFDEAVALLNAQGVVIDTAAIVMPDEFPEVDKKELVNVPLMLLTWNISNPERGEFEGQYITVRGITKAGKRFRFSDGSRGVFMQLRNLTGMRISQGYATPNAGLVVEKGLVRSDYKFTDDKGKQTNATTYYLANE